jgi:hypothetical protein
MAEASRRAREQAVGADEVDDPRRGLVEADDPRRRVDAAKDPAHTLPVGEEPVRSAARRRTVGLPACAGPVPEGEEPHPKAPGGTGPRRLIARSSDPPRTGGASHPVGPRRLIARSSGSVDPRSPAGEKVPGLGAPPAPDATPGGTDGSGEGAAIPRRGAASTEPSARPHREGRPLEAARRAAAVIRTHLSIGVAAAAATVLAIAAVAVVLGTGTGGGHAIGHAATAHSARRDRGGTGTGPPTRASAGSGASSAAEAQRGNAPATSGAASQGSAPTTAPAAAGAPQVTRAATSPTTAPPTPGIPLTADGGAPGGPPQITSLSGSSGPAGTTVVLHGTGFYSPDGQVTAYFGAAPAPTSCTNQTTCAVTVPDLGPAPATVTLTVVTSSGTSNGEPFDYG